MVKIDADSGKKIEEPAQKRRIHPKVFETSPMALLEYNCYKCRGVSFVAFPDVVLKSQEREALVIRSSFGAFAIIGSGANNGHRY